MPKIDHNAYEAMVLGSFDLNDRAPSNVPDLGSTFGRKAGVPRVSFVSSLSNDFAPTNA